MAVRARHSGQGPAHQGVRARGVRPRVATTSHTNVASPALMLQEALSAELADPAVKKWPPIATLGFIVATCGTFWAAVGLGVARLAG